MLGRIDSCAVLGIDAHVIQAQADVGSGQTKVTVVGLPDTAVQEARDRVASAIRNSSFSFPTHRVTINLAPADLRKEGPAFDLPMALAVLAATEQIVGPDMDKLIAVGELSLDGSVRRISGVLPIALAARKARCAGLIVPADNIAEATIIEGLNVYPVRTLWEAAEVVAYPEQRKPAPLTPFDWQLADPTYPIDFSEVNRGVRLRLAPERPQATPGGNGRGRTRSPGPGGRRGTAAYPRGGGSPGPRPAPAPR
jgi:magnesium chelatase family protein